MNGPTSRLALCALILTAGCKHPEITAVPLSPWNQCEDAEGIPFYLPKPLLIVAKNFRQIEEAKVGLTSTAPIPDGYDDQSKYGDVNARTSFNTSAGTAPSGSGTNTGSATAGGQILHSENGAPVTPGTVPSDGLAPETFYTYQIVFVPDMTQKYGLKIKGGAGEFRAAMNLVNGWQYTGLGPFYMKDSSSAQNIMASGITANLAGQGVADVVNSVADLAGSLQSGETTDSSNPQVQRVSEKIGALPLSIQPMVLDNFAEIHVYEPNVTPDGMMVWSEIVCLSFDRHVLGTKECDITTTSAPAAASQQTKNVTRAGGLQTGESALGRAVVANALGIPLDSPALQELSAGGLQSGETGASVPSIMNQVQVGCGEECKPSKTVNLFNFGKHHENPRRPRIETRRVIGPSSNLFALPQGSGGATESGGSAGPQGEGGLNSDEISDGFSTMPPVNQPIINQPIMDGDALRKLLIPEPKNDQNAGNTDAPEEIPELDLRPQ